MLKFINHNIEPKISANIPIPINVYRKLSPIPFGSLIEGIGKCPSSIIQVITNRYKLLIHIIGINDVSLKQI